MRKGCRIARCEGRKERVVGRLLASTRLRSAMMNSISQIWKRSTMSAQVSWKRFSFSIFLKTVPLISTN